MRRRLPKIKLKRKIQLNLGCGKKIEKNFINIDIRDWEQEIVWDLREGIPFPDNSVDVVWSQHLIEHLTNDESKDLLKEIYRVLKVGGVTMHTMPHASDPTSCYFDHETFWNEQRVDVLPLIEGLENFKILKNQMDEAPGRRAFRELFFMLQKIK